MLKTFGFFFSSTKFIKNLTFHRCLLVLVSLSSVGHFYNDDNDLNIDIKHVLS